MHKPESEEILVIRPGDSSPKTVVIHISPSSKLIDLRDTYFRHIDPEFGDDDTAVAAVQRVYLRLLELPQVSHDTEGAQWLETESRQYITVLPLPNVESLLAEEIKATFKQDPYDDENPDCECAFLALGMGIDLMAWMNRQLPAIVREQAQQKTERDDVAQRRAKFPAVIEGARYFVTSASDTPERIFFSDLDAFESDALYIDVFNEKGEKIQSFKYCTAGEQPNLAPEFEGYTTQF